MAKTRKRTPQIATSFGSFFIKNGGKSWRLSGSGVNGHPSGAPRTKQVIQLLERLGFEVPVKCIGGMVSPDLYTFRVTFLDGGVAAETGNYLFAPKGAWVRGTRAVYFLALELGLRVQRRFLSTHGLERVTLDELRAELSAQKAKPS